MGKVVSLRACQNNAPRPRCVPPGCSDGGGDGPFPPPPGSSVDARSYGIAQPSRPAASQVGPVVFPHAINGTGSVRPPNGPTGLMPKHPPELVPVPPPLQSPFGGLVSKFETPM